MSNSAGRFIKSVARRIILSNYALHKAYLYIAFRLKILPPQRPKSPKPVVYSLVSNTGMFDSRVMKQARSLCNAGYDVKLYCAHGDGLPSTQIIDGIELRRFRPFDSNIQLNDSDRATVLRLFGAQRSLVEASAFDVGELGADVSMYRSLANAVRRRMSVFRIGDPARVELETQLDEIRQRVQGSSQARRRLLLARKAYLYTYYFAANFLAIDFPEVPSCIHCHDIYPLPAAIELARRTGAKVVFDAHEIETERLPPFAPPEKSFIDSVERFWLTQVDAMIVCCESAADFYSSRFTRGRPQIVMNAPDADLDAVSTFDLRGQCGVAEADPLVIYTGGVGREARGLHLVVQALKLLPEFHLAVLGPRHVLNDRWIEDVAQGAGVRERLHLLPPVPYTDVVSAVRSADIGVCAIQDASLSYRYAMPNKLFEMAFAGVPLCVSNLPEMARFVLENTVGTVMNETEPADIARALQETYSRRHQLRKDRDGMMSLINKYAWPVQAKKLIRLYADMEGNHVHSLNSVA